MTTNNLACPIVKKAWSLVLKGVVWAGFKLLVGVVLIVSRGPGSCAGKVGAYNATTKRGWLRARRVSPHVFKALPRDIILENGF